MTAKRDPRRNRRDYSKPHRLFVEDTPAEVRAILEEAAELGDEATPSLAPDQSTATPARPGPRPPRPGTGPAPIPPAS